MLLDSRTELNVVDNIYFITFYPHLGQHIFADSQMTVQTSSCQSCVNAVDQRGHSDKAAQSRIRHDVSRRVRRHTCHVSQLSYISCHPAQLGTIIVTVTVVMKVLCILALVLAAVSATHVDLAPELDRMAIVPEER